MTIEVGDEAVAEAEVQGQLVAGDGLVEVGDLEGEPKIERFVCRVVVVFAIPARIIKFVGRPCLAELSVGRGPFESITCESGQRDPLRSLQDLDQGLDLVAGNCLHPLPAEFLLKAVFPAFVEIDHGAFKERPAIILKSAFEQGFADRFHV